MSKWTKYQREEDFAKFAKIRRGMKNPRRGTQDLQQDFILKETKWPKEDGKQFAARVVEVHKRYAFVSREPQVGEIDTHDIWLATVAKKYLTAKRVERNFVCVGDRVFCRVAETKETIIQSDLPQCVIEFLSPRKTKIARIDPADENREHILASNIGQVLIVGSYRKPNIKWGLIDRYLALAEAQEIQPIIIINKADLLEGELESIEECDKHEKYLMALGYPVFRIQANDEALRKSARFRELCQMLDHKINLITGHSGVGKSTIVNLFDPQIIQEVEPDDDIFYKGRHTTSYASFLKLGTGGYIIDTPGIRSFVLDDQTAIDLSHCFREFRPLIGQCKFRECGHVEEPDCAVRQAVDAGEIADWRYKSYLGILLKTTGREGRIREIEE